MSSSMIAQQITDLAESMATQPHNEVMDAFARERAALAATGKPDKPLAVGSVLPNTNLLDAHGASTTLCDAMGRRAAVVVLYRGAWCPYRNIALRTYQEQLLPMLSSRAVGFVAVSPQTPDGSLRMQEKNDLAFPVLSDPGNTIARTLGVLTTPSAEARQAQLQLGLDLTTANADGTIEVPMPTTVILDKNHTVRWIDVHPDRTTRSETAEIIDAVDTTLKRTSRRSAPS